MTKQEEYTLDFIDCVNELVEEFVRDINVSKDTDGKYSINFEDFFRYLTINYSEIYDDETVYNRLKQFMFSRYNSTVILLDKANGLDHVYNVRNEIEHKLVISKRSRFNYLDISASVTVLKITWGDEYNDFVFEMNDRIDEIQKGLFKLLRNHNSIRVLDLSELRRYHSSHNVFSADDAFLRHCHLEELYLPESEERIWNHDIRTLKVLSAPGATSICLHNTPKLTKIIFGNRLKELRLKNVGISNIKIPSSLHSLVINGCNGLRQLRIPDGIRLAAHSLSKNVNLENVVLPKDLPIIEPYLFEDCENLRSIKGGKGLLYIFPSAFIGCSSLESIECPKIYKFVTNEPSESEWMKFRSTIRNEEEETSYYTKFLSELKEKQIDNVSEYVEEKYFPREIDDVVCLRYGFNKNYPDDGLIFWSLRKGRYYTIAPEKNTNYSIGDIFRVLVCDKKTIYDDGRIIVIHVHPVISLCKKERLTDNSFWDEYEDDELVINKRIHEYKSISSYVSGKSSFSQECIAIEQKVKSLDINAIIDSYDIKERTWWVNHPGKDDDECFERVVTSIYSDSYLEQLLPQNSEKYYSSGGGRPWLDWGESETERLQAAADEKTKQLKENALKMYSQSEHIRTLIVEKAKEHINTSIEIERKYHLDAAIRFLLKTNLGDNHYGRQEKLFSFRLSNIINDTSFN